MALSGSRILIAVALGGGFLLGGCATRTPALEVRRHLPLPTRLPEIMWPERERTQSAIELVVGSDVFELIDHGVRGEGQLLELRDLPDIELEAGTSYPYEIEATEGNFSLHGTLRPPSRREEVRDRRFLVFVSSSGAEAIVTEETRESFTVSLFDRPSSLTAIVYQSPATEHRAGLVLFAGSLGGVKSGERTLLRTLSARGWSILWVSTELGGIPRHYYDVTDGIDDAAAAFATDLDDGMAERAYALAAAYDLLDEVDPEITQLPMLAIGSSAGALALPAVLARIESPPDAAIFIGGAADLPRTLTSSSLLAPLIRISRAGGGLSTDERNAVIDRARDLTLLDPYHLAPLLRQVPTLQLQARYDAIVPARQGDVLYERLGGPERWVFPVGHLGLYALLGGQVDAIVDWVERQIPTSPEATDENP